MPPRGGFLKSELVEPKISQHRGRTVKNTGDGLLAEFVSIVDAVRCAAEIQRGMIDREPAVPEEHRIRFRIGINLADVIVEERDIFGRSEDRLGSRASFSTLTRRHLSDQNFAFEDL
jgi:class 3 adenylate cyclase